MDILDRIGRGYYEQLAEYHIIARTGVRVARWDQLDPATKQMTIQHIIRVAKSAPGQITPELEHGDWVGKRLLDGWRFGEEFSYREKTSPLLVRYADLPDVYKPIPALFLNHVQLYRPVLLRFLESEMAGMDKAGVTINIGSVQNLFHSEAC